MPNNSTQSVVVGEEYIIYSPVMLKFEEEDEDQDPDLKKPEKGLGDDDADLEDIDDLIDKEDAAEDDDDAGGSDY